MLAFQMIDWAMIERDLDAQMPDPASDQARLNALPEPRRAIYVAHQGAIVDCLHVARVFFAGFDSIAASLASDPDPWVASVPRPRSGGRICGMVATSVCAVVEGYVRAMAPERLAPAVLSAWRTCFEGLPKQDEKLEKQILRSVLPSSFEGPVWVTKAELLFGIDLTEAERTTLRDLSEFRNIYMHDPAKAAALGMSGEKLKCWTLAAILLCKRIALVVPTPTL